MSENRIFINLNPERKAMLDKLTEEFINFYNQHGIDWQQDQNPHNRLLHRFFYRGLKEYGIVMGRKKQTGVSLGKENQEALDWYFDELKFKEAMKHNG